MRYKTLGKTGEKVSAIGLGCMGLSSVYGAADQQEALATLNLAVELGLNFWDTTDFCAGGRNGELISKVLRPSRDRVFIATKFGFRMRNEALPVQRRGNPNVYFDRSPGYLKKAVEISLRRLDIETIDLFYAHRVDPNEPIEDMVGAMAELVKEGKVRYLGLAEVSADSIRRAHSVHPIAALQSERSILSREAEEQLLPVCRELGITFMAYSPLSRGLVTNRINREDIGAEDFRKRGPRFRDENWANNKILSDGFAEIAMRKGVTAAQLALAVVLAMGPEVIPIPGAKQRKCLLENIRATEVKLGAAELVEIDSLLTSYPNTGSRYSEAALNLVNL